MSSFDCSLNISSFLFVKNMHDPQQRLKESLQTQAFSCTVSFILFADAFCIFSAKMFK